MIPHITSRTLLQVIIEKTHTHAPTVVALTGCSGSGKSTLTAQLETQLQLHGFSVLVLSTDNYFFGMTEYLAHVDDPLLRHDQPSAFNLALCVAHLDRLRERVGNSVVHPAFFIREQLKNEPRSLVSTQVILFEGLFSLYGDLAACSDIKVFLDTSLATCRKRRIAREVTDHGTDPAHAAHEYDTIVLPAYERFIAPTRKKVDFLFHAE